MITADRGLCGSFNSNIIKAAGQFIVNDGRDEQVALGLIGRKGRDFFRRRGFDVRYEAVGIFQRLSFNDAERDRQRGDRRVHVGTRVERVPRLQRVQVGDVAAHRGRAAAADSAAGQRRRRRRRPSTICTSRRRKSIFKDLLPRHVQVQVYRALLESNAAFFAAQMTAMDAATRNSAEMIDNLTLYMNKVRQAAITREIIEVVSGAAAT